MTLEDKLIAIGRSTSTSRRQELSTELSFCVLGLLFLEGQVSGASAYHSESHDCGRLKIIRIKSICLGSRREVATMRTPTDIFVVRDHEHGNTGHRLTQKKKKLMAEGMAFTASEINRKLEGNNRENRSKKLTVRRNGEKNLK